MSADLAFPEQTVLVKYEAACRALAEARNVDEVKTILNVSIAMACYAKQAQNKTAEADATEIRLRATRRLGEMMQAQTETVGLNEGGRPKTGLSENPVSETPPTLAAAGIDKNLAHRARTLSGLADEEFNRVVNETREKITNEADRIAKRTVNIANRQATKAASAVAPDGRYSCIVIDPPWPMEKIEREVRPNQVGFDYPTMDEDELSEFGVLDMAADDCHLFCWTTHKFLPMALRIIDQWDFRYVCTMVWHKPGGFQPMGLPQFNCEFVLYARRGSPRFVETKDLFACFNAPRREHSRKPDEFYDVVRRVTGAPRIDVFSRERRNGFDQYGNQTEKFA